MACQLLNSLGATPSETSDHGRREESIESESERRGAAEGGRGVDEGKKGGRWMTMDREEIRRSSDTRILLLKGGVA